MTLTRVEHSVDLDQDNFDDDYNSGLVTQEEYHERLIELQD